MLVTVVCVMVSVGLRSCSIARRLRALVSGVSGGG